MTRHQILPSRRDTSSVDLSEIVSKALNVAAEMGADAASAGVVRSRGYDLTVRLGELETIEYENGGAITVTTYCGDRRGSSSTNDFDDQAIVETVRAATTIAKFTASDPCNGLPPPERLARHEQDLELNNPWEIDRDQALDLALECEHTARSADERIVNSEGASLSTYVTSTVMGNSDDFLVSLQTTRHAMSCSVVGMSDSNGMQRDYWYSSARDPDLLDSPKLIGEIAAQRTLRKLDARKIKTREVPVLFEAPVASSLLSHFISAISGGAQYRNASFLLDSIGQQVFPTFVHIHEQPHLKRALGSTYFDQEGVATQTRDLVRDGELLSFVLDSYSARKLGMETTGNAGGVFNLTLDSGDRNFKALLEEMDTGLLVSELIGFGVNNVTGDYSRGASGFWIENGQIQYPVEEITIAGNLKDMFQGIVEVGTDIDLRGNIRTGSILIDNMAVAGE